MKIQFYTPEYSEAGLAGSFGGATLGFSTENQWVDPALPAVIDFPVELEGTALTGSLEQVLADMRHFPEKDLVKAAIVLFGNCGGEEDFLAQLNTLFPGIPVTGGSTAVGSDGQTGRMLGGPAQVSVLLITDDTYDYHVTSTVIHWDVVEELTVLGEERRRIQTVRRANGEEVAFMPWFEAMGKDFGIGQNLTELLAIHDPSGRNLHLVNHGDHYEAGADLPADRKVQIRRVSYSQAFERIKDFYQNENSIIFGCAGLKGLLKDGSFLSAAGTLGLFMFGEVLTVDAGAVFANLSLSRLELAKKK